MIVNPVNPQKLAIQLTAKPLVLYGMGGAGLRIAEWCDSMGIDYVFADREAAKNKNKTDKTVIEPELLPTKYADANVVISSIIYFDEMYNTLRKYGFCEERIISYKIFMPDDLAWSDLDDNVDWDLMRCRVKMFSAWLGPEVKSVADYGSGKMYLKEYLAPDVAYHPIDYIRRSDETIMCDLNSGIFPDLQTDVAICSGVLEFIHTAEPLLKHVCANTDKAIIMSYMTIDLFPDMAGRRVSAYVSDLTEKRIMELMSSGGFIMEKVVPDPVNSACSVYLFIKGEG